MPRRLIELLSGTPLREAIPEHRKVIVLQHNATVGEALQTFGDNGILSAPVVLEPDIDDGVMEGYEGSIQVVGWIDAQGILSALLEYLRRTQEVTMEMMQLMMALESEGSSFAHKTLITILANEDREFLFDRDSAAISIADAISTLFFRHMPDGSVKVSHRVALFNGHGEITAIISQMDVIRWILQHADELGEIGVSSIADLGLLTGSKPVLSVNPYDPCILAFDKMTKANVSGSPVVTEQGEAIANLSISDLRGLTAEHFGLLALPVGEFIALKKGVQFVGYEGTSGERDHHSFFKAKRQGTQSENNLELITVTPQASLVDVLRKCAGDHHRVHRLYVVPSEESHRIESVLTITDLLRFFASFR